jgi:predicted nucleotidyltransferase
MIADRDRRILDLFAARVRQHFPAARIWAFGSRARGDSTWESDLDVCVVLKQYASATDNLIGQIVWEVGFEQEVVIAPLCFASEEFKHGPMSETTLVANILHDGVAA